MNVTRENTDNYQAVLTITVDAPELEKAEKQACQRLSNRVNIPGFRKGKTPRNVLEQYVGKEGILEEAFDIICPSTLQQAFEQEKIIPVTRPEIDVVTLEKGKDVVFKATITPSPEVTLGEYKGIKIPKEPVEVSDDDVNEQLERMRERRGKLVDAPEGAAAESGDMVTLDFKGFVNGEAFSGGEGKDYPLQLGSNQFIPGFEDQLIGVKADEDREIHVTFPEDYHSEDLAGKEATFQCKVHSIRKRELPPLDDELAKAISTFQTLDELRSDIRENLVKMREQEAENKRRDEAVEKAAENITADIPPVMIDQQVDHMVQDLSLRLESQKLSMEQYLQYSGTDMDRIREDFRETAEKTVRRDLALDKIAEVEGIKVEEDDLSREITAMAVSYGVKPKDVRKIIRDQGSMSGLVVNILRKKSIQFIIDRIEE